MYFQVLQQHWKFTLKSTSDWNLAPWILNTSSWHWTKSAFKFDNFAFLLHYLNLVNRISIDHGLGSVNEWMSGFSAFLWSLLSVSASSSLPAEPMLYSPRVKRLGLQKQRRSVFHCDVSEFLSLCDHPLKCICTRFCLKVRAVVALRASTPPGASPCAMPSFDLHTFSHIAR